MSEVRSDNRLERHPKPVQEYERKLVDGEYVDWASFAEWETAYNAAYRANKYLWVDNVLWHCYAVGFYRQVSGGGSGGGGLTALNYTVVSDASVITIPQLNGHVFNLLVQGTQAYNSQYITQTGTDLDCSNIGGVYAGDVLTILYT